MQRSWFVLGAVVAACGGESESDIAKGGSGGEQTASPEAPVNGASPRGGADPGGDRTSAGTEPGATDGGDGGGAPSPSTGWLAKSAVVWGGTTCAVGTDGALFCWGDNIAGMVGDGTATRRSTPLRIALPAPVRQVEMGGYTTFAVLDSGEVWAWGCNVTGKLGDGTQTSGPLGTCHGRSTPGRVGTASAPLGNVEEIATDGLGVVARQTSGALMHWGGIQISNEPAPPLVPRALGGASNQARSVANGEDMMCFARANETFGCIDPGPGASTYYDNEYVGRHLPPDAKVLAVFGSTSNALCVHHRGPCTNAIPGECVTCLGSAFSVTTGAATVGSHIAVSAPRSMELRSNFLNVVRADGTPERWAGKPLSRRPLPALPQKPAKLLTGSGEEGCVVFEDGQLWCWVPNEVPRRVEPS